jgi:hypothetical protein
MFKANCQDLELATLDASLHNVAYQTGHIYPQWLAGIDVQLLKCSKDKCVEKLRTILCLEADCNLNNNKKFGRELMWTAEANGTLTHDNYGGCKHLRAVETNLNQYLTYDSIRAQRGRAVIMSIDAKGCYDRIARKVVLMCMLQQGALKITARAIIKSIKQLKHFIKTAFGTSKESYGADPSKEPSGLLQESKSSALQGVLNFVDPCR